MQVLVPTPPARSLAALVAAVGALLVGASLFLPWVRLEASAATAWREAVERKIRERPLAPAPEEEYRQLALTLEKEGALRGTDLLLWARTAQDYGRALVKADEADGGVLRVLTVARGGLLLFPLGAFFLLAMVLAARLRPPSSFVLAFTFLLGAIGVGTVAGVKRVFAQLALELPELGEQLALGAGLDLLLAGSAPLVLSGLFGLRPRQLPTWLLWVGLLGGGLALGLRTYLRGA